MHKLIVVAVLLLAGCGSTPAQEAANRSAISPAAGTAGATPVAAGTSGACDILTQADAEAALGHAVTRRADAGGGGLDICRYGYEGKDRMDRGNVSVTIQPIDIATLMQAVARSGVDFEPVPGLGDDAHYSREAGMYVGKGNRTAIYRLGKIGLSDARETTIALARATVEKL